MLDSEYPNLANIKTMIDEVEFHDLPVDGISFGVDDKRIVLVVLKFNEHSQEYDRIEFLFSNTSDLILEDRNFLAIQEITHYELSAIGQRHRIQIMFLTGFSGPSLTMEFWFDDLSVQQLAQLP